MRRGAIKSGLPSRHAHLNISLSSRSLTASCRIEHDRHLEWESPPLYLDVERSEFLNRIKELTNILNHEQVKIWDNLVNPLAKPFSDIARTEFKSCMERVVTEGAKLYGELERIGLRSILRELDDRLQEGDWLTIRTNSAFLPWEILYPLTYNRLRPDPTRYLPHRLWGYRFMIDYLLEPTPDEGGWTPPLKEHQNGRAFVSLNINKNIDNAFLQRPFKPVAYHYKFFKDSIGRNGKLLDDAQRIIDFLLSEKNHATIIYLYCHSRTNGQTEELELDEKTYINSGDLDNGNRYLRGPVVFLNSCGSAAQSPLTFSSFHREFRRKGAMGVIGTTIQIPATFAAAFGREIIECYLRGLPIGPVLYQLRKQLVDRDNPLGLFYSLQCPVYVSASTGRGSGS